MNQRLPSGPAVMLDEAALAVGIGYWATMVPATSITAIALASTPAPFVSSPSMNQRLPSGPVVMSRGRKERGYSVNEPARVIRPIPTFSMYQSAPSEPTVM